MRSESKKFFVDVANDSPSGQSCRNTNKSEGEDDERDHDEHTTSMVKTTSTVNMVNTTTTKSMMSITNTVNSSNRINILGNNQDNTESISPADPHRRNDTVLCSFPSPPGMTASMSNNKANKNSDSCQRIETTQPVLGNPLWYS